MMSANERSTKLGSRRVRTVVIMKEKLMYRVTSKVTQFRIGK